MDDVLKNMARKSCTTARPDLKPLEPAAIESLLASFPGWHSRDGAIAKTFRFENYYQTMAFVNATAWISHRQDHHPDLKVGYNSVEISYSTHSAGGITELDLICAAKIEKLLEL